MSILIIQWWSINWIPNGPGWMCDKWRILWFLWGDWTKPCKENIFTNEVCVEQHLIQFTFLSVVTPYEIHKITYSLRNWATGYDELSVSILKLLSHLLLALLLTYVTNDLTKVFSQWNLRSLMSLCKADDPTISMTLGLCPYCVFCQKVFERVIYNHLVEYLEMLNILNSKN